MKLSRALQVFFALATLAVATACGGGGSSSPNPVPTPTPTSPPTLSPTPTPTPLPTGTLGPGAVTQPVVLATPIQFPTNSGYGGFIEFDSTSTPSSGVSITMWTSIALPGGYPTVLPPTASFGAGALPIAPWLTFFLSQTLTLGAPSNPSGPEITIGFALPPSFTPSGQYAAALFDLSQNNQLLASLPISFTPSQRPIARMSRAALVRALARHASAFEPAASCTLPQLCANDRYYLGLFKLPPS